MISSADWFGHFMVVRLSGEFDGQNNPERQNTPHHSGAITNSHSVLVGCTDTHFALFDDITQCLDDKKNFGAQMTLYNTL